MSYINKNKPKIVEGELRIKELSHYLESLKLEKNVWLSEDATGITAKVEFDLNTNQMVGLVLPIDTRTGMPKPFSYLARNEEEIFKNMEREKSNYVYIVMAQPLVQGVPPFILQLYGTDSKFKTQDVLFRWRHTVDELNK